MVKIMKFYTSDLHFNHANIIKYCNRPFEDTQEMDSYMIQRWNSKIKPEDEVYILGDFCMGNQQQAIQYLQRLKGKKYFIKGNHDRFLGSVTKFPHLEWVRSLTTISDGGRSVVLCHYPLESWDRKFHGSYHLYGHVHNSEPVSTIENRFNVGVDVNDFEPKTLDELINNEHN